MFLSNWKMFLASVLRNYNRYDAFYLDELSFAFFSSFSKAVIVFFRDYDSSYKLSTLFLSAASCFKAYRSFFLARDFTSAFKESIALSFSAISYRNCCLS